MKRLFLIIGAPGSGKTTDANLIAKNDTKFVHYSTGDLLRAEVNNKTELGELIDSFISQGNLVPIEVVINTIISAIESSKNEYILLDGYPRSVEQMLELDKVLSIHKDIKLCGVIEVEVGEKIARQRVLGRARGADDNHEVFNTRMNVYLEPIKEIREFYTNKNILFSINGERKIDEIVLDIEKILQSLI